MTCRRCGKDGHGTAACKVPFKHAFKNQYAVRIIVKTPDAESDVSGPITMRLAYWIIDKIFPLIYASSHLDERSTAEVFPGDEAPQL